MIGDNRDEVDTCEWSLGWNWLFCGAGHHDDGDGCGDVADVDDDIDGPSFEALPSEMKKDIALVLEIISFSRLSFSWLHVFGHRLGKNIS